MDDLNQRIAAVFLSQHKVERPSMYSKISANLKLNSCLFSLKKNSIKWSLKWLDRYKWCGREKGWMRGNICNEKIAVLIRLFYAQRTHSLFLYVCLWISAHRYHKNKMVLQFSTRKKFAGHGGQVFWKKNVIWKESYTH